VKEALQMHDVYTQFAEEYMAMPVIKGAKSENERLKLNKGWNTIYITDAFKNVPFYVRGNEFTSQLFYFTDKILDKSMVDICSFDDASITQRVIEEIRADAKINMGVK